MKQSIGTIFFFLLTNLSIQAQQIMTTKSGQVIEVDENGSYKYITDTLDLNLHNENYQMLAATLKNMEAEKETEMIRLDKMSVPLNTSLSKAKLEKNKEEITRINSELKSIKRRLSTIKDELKTVSKDMLMMRQLAKTKLITEVTQKYAQKYSITLESEVASDVEIVAIPFHDTITNASESTSGYKPFVSDTASIPMVTISAKSKYERVVDASKARIVKQEKKKLCEILFNGKYEETGKKMVQTKYVSYFNHTPKRLENYFKAQEYLQGSVSIMQHDDDYYLVLELRFNSKDVKKSYGKITKDDFMKIQFIEGPKIFLKASHDAEAIIESFTGNTIYKAQYKFAEKEDYNTASNLLVDTLGIMWSSGFEEYQIFDVQLLKDQINCFDDSK